jgi:hypothetical protein
MLDVTNAKYVGGYRIWIEFSNGESGVVDLEPDLWGPIFEPLRDPEKFKRFQVSGVLHTLVWDNDADFAPEHLYERMSKPSLQPTSLSRGG